MKSKRLFFQFQMDNDNPNYFVCRFCGSRISAIVLDIHSSKCKKGNHKCRYEKLCNCSIVDTEPDPKCPIHSGYNERKRCIICGKFMK